MPPPPLITLTTDFGDDSTWAAQMKGVILGIAPEAVVIDLTHGVPPHDVSAGAYLLESGVDAFPRGTIHVAVVDPGVGTSRRPVVIRTESFLLVGPDNGILARALRRHPVRGAWLLDATHYRAQSVSPTFEGRDVFAPAAAWLARGTDPSRFGPEIDGLVGLTRSEPPPAVPPGRFRVRVVHVDRFGNAVLDVAAEGLAEWRDPSSGLPRLRAATGAGVTVDAVLRTFADGVPGVPFLLVNSAGYVEVSMREDSAARHLGLKVGDELELSFAG